MSLPTTASCCPQVLRTWHGSFEKKIMQSSNKERLLDVLGHQKTSEVGDPQFYSSISTRPSPLSSATCQSGRAASVSQLVLIVQVGPSVAL